MNVVLTSAVILSIFSHGLASRTNACFKGIRLSKNGVQNLTSPGFPHHYGPNVNCGWNISASSTNHLVGVNISYFHLEDSGKCQDASLFFYNGSDTSGGLLLELCGNETKESSVLSSEDTMYIEFVSGPVSNGIGFSLTVMDIGKCGGRLTAITDTQQLTLPGHPYTYFNNLRCMWIITAENENNTVVTKIRDVKMGVYAVRVFNGNTTEVDQFLGESAPWEVSTFYSSTDSMLMEFTTERSITSKGFEILYTVRPEGICDGHVHIYENPMYILSPGYPDSYPSNLDCFVTISSSVFPNMRIDVLFSDIEGDYPQCDNDSVTLLNNEDTIGVFCGNSSTSPVGPYYSNGNYMQLEFKTGNDTSGKGFRLRGTPSSRKVIPHYHATTYPHFLQSPGYPVITQNMLDCIWVITASDPQMMVRIDVIDSEVQTDELEYLRCKDSRVTAYNGPTIFNDTILFWCGVSRPSLQSTGSAMTIQFTTRNSDDKRGFKLKYFETNETFKCGGIVNVTTNESTILAGAYDGEEDCHWTIHGPANTNIQVDITNVGNPVYGDTCFASYLELYDGNTAGSHTPGRWCGIQDKQYISTGNIITARLHIFPDFTDGLQLYLKAGHFNVSSTKVLSASYLEDYLTTPNYPFDCPRLTEYTWKIEGGDSSINNIKITVVNSTLDNSDGCRNDYVEAFDGPDANAPSLGRWCGGSTPTKTGSASTMFLKFRPNSSHAIGRRFKIRYVLENNIDTGSNLVVAYVGAGFGGIALVVLIVISIWGRANRKRRREPLISPK